MEKSKRIVRAAMLLASALLLAGCTASGFIDGTAQTDTPPQTEAPVKAVNAPAETAAPEQAAGFHAADFDGDGVGDEADVTFVQQEDGEAYACLDIALGSGQTVRQLIPGWWHSHYTLVYEDLNGNGRDDILLVLDVAGSNYGAVNIFIYSLEGDALVEYPSNFIRNRDITAEQPADYKEENLALIGAGIVTDSDGENLVYFLDEIDSHLCISWRITAQWAGDGWFVRNVELIKPYEDNALIDIDMDPKMPFAPERYDWNTELIFITDGKSNKLDPDASYYDIERNMMTIPLRRIAEDALDKLYKTTSQRLEKCYITVIGDYGTIHQYIICFTADERYDFDHEGFYAVSVDSSTGKYIYAHILYKEDVPYSPISKKVG